MAFVQKIVRDETELIDIAIKYYSMLSILQELNLPVRQVQLLAFTAIRGTITPLAAREEFVKMFSSSLASIENMKGKLYKQNLLVLSKDMYKVNPLIIPDFTQDVYVFQITINLKDDNSEG